MSVEKLTESDRKDMELDYDYTTTEDTTTKNSIHPSHYACFRYEPVKVIQDWKLNFCLGNVIKYIARAGKKEGSPILEDLEKAKRCLELEIEEVKRTCQKN